jgi:hypothetical protein
LARWTVARKIDLNRLDLRIGAGELARRRADRVVFGGDQKIEAVDGELARELEPDPAGRAGNDRERPRFSRATTG